MTRTLRDPKCNVSHCLNSPTTQRVLEIALCACRQGLQLLTDHSRGEVFMQCSAIAWGEGTEERALSLGSLGFYTVALQKLTVPISSVSPQVEDPILWAEKGVISHRNQQRPDCMGSTCQRSRTFKCNSSSTLTEEISREE